MTRVVLIRPGSTQYDCENRIQGNLDVPLNEAGGAEVSRLIAELEFMGIESVYSAPCQAAMETAQMIAKAFGLKLRKLSRLRNLDHGLWQGMLVKEVRQKQPKVYRQWQETPRCVCPPEGEMVAQAEERLGTSMMKLIRRHRDGVVAVVVAEPMASLVRCFLTHEEVGNLWKAPERHGRWEVVDVHLEDVMAGSSN